MCIANAMELSLKSDTFSALKEDFDSILGRTIGNMQMKGAEDATITLKLSVSLENTMANIKGENTDITRPSFKHDISSVMQVKDKKSGALTGDYQLVWDEDEGKYVMKRIDNGQMTLFDENGDIISPDDNTIDAEYREVPALELPASEDEENEARTPFGWLKQFIGQEMKVTESMGNYAVRTLDNKIVLTSSTTPDNVFYCEAETLERHLGHKLACVGYGSDDDIVNVSIECEDCNEVIFDIDIAPDTDTEESDEETLSDEELMESVENEANDEDDSPYSDNEEEIDDIEYSDEPEEYDEETYNEEPADL